MTSRPASLPPRWTRPQAPLRLLNGYFVNGQEPGSEKLAYKMRWLQALQDMVRARWPRTRAWCCG